MNRENVFLADPYAEKPTYIMFKELVFKTVNVEICIKLENEYIVTPLSMIVWKSTGEFKPIFPHNPPILFNCPMYRQLFISNSSEVLNLYSEAINKRAYEQIEDNLIEVKLFDLRKSYNILDSENMPLNRWVSCTPYNMG